jgi:hypothetical protein
MLVVRLRTRGTNAAEDKTAAEAISSVSYAITRKAIDDNL